MSAREVVALGETFRRREGELHDAGVALDEVMAMRPGVEPILLRVEAEGGAPGEAALVAGDWLCDVDGAAPRRVPYIASDARSEPAVRGARWIDAWERGEDARRLLRLAADVGVDRRLIVSAACACARTVTDVIPRGDLRASTDRVVSAAESWARGEATAGSVDAARQWCRGVDAGEPISAAAATAIASATWAAGAVSRDPGDAAATCADYAASAYSSAYFRSSGPSKRRQLAHLAWLVRSKVPTVEVLRGAVKG